MASVTISAPRHLLITGIPGIGKTTLIDKLHQELVRQNIQCSGFFTEEVRSGGRRIGFDVVTMNGQRGQLARVSDPSDGMPGSRQRDYKVGQYSVKLFSFEQIALPTLHAPSKDGEKNGVCLFLIDEIGKMELFSQPFIQAVRRLLTHPEMTIVATIPAQKGKPIPFVEELRNSSTSLVFEVTRGNRDNLLSDVLGAVHSSLQANSR